MAISIGWSLWCAPLPLFNVCILMPISTHILHLNLARMFTYQGWLNHIELAGHFQGKFHLSVVESKEPKKRYMKRMMAIDSRIDPATVKWKVAQMEPAAIRNTGLPSKNTLTWVQKGNGCRCNRINNLHWHVWILIFSLNGADHLSHFQYWGTMNFGQAKGSNMNDVDRTIPPRHPAKLAVNSPLRMSLRQVVEQHFKLTHCFRDASIHPSISCNESSKQSINQPTNESSNKPIQRLISPIFFIWLTSFSISISINQRKGHTLDCNTDSSQLL